MVLLLMMVVEGFVGSVVDDRGGRLHCWCYWQVVGWLALDDGCDGFFVCSWWRDRGGGRAKVGN